MLKLQYFGHLMGRALLWERTLMLGKIESRRRKGQQRMRRLDGITDSMDMSLSQFQEMVKDREAWRPAVHRIAKSQTQLSYWTITKNNSPDCWVFSSSVHSRDPKWPPSWRKLDPNHSCRSVSWAYSQQNRVRGLTPLPGRSTRYRGRGKSKYKALRQRWAQGRRAASETVGLGVRAKMGSEAAGRPAGQTVQVCGHAKEASLSEQRWKPNLTDRHKGMAS